MIEILKLYEIGTLSGEHIGYEVATSMEDAFGDRGENFTCVEINETLTPDVIKEVIANDLDEDGETKRKLYANYCADYDIRRTFKKYFEEEEIKVLNENWHCIEYLISNETETLLILTVAKHAYNPFEVVCIGSGTFTRKWFVKSWYMFLEDLEEQWRSYYDED